MSESTDEHAAKDCGELAFEHGLIDGISEFWRVLYWNELKEGRPVRSSNFYASKADALAKIEHINNRDWLELISLRKYTLVP